MKRTILTLAILATGLGTRAGWALDPSIAGGVGGLGGRAVVSTALGRNSEDGLSHPGFPARTGSGQVGVTPGGVTGGTNIGTSDGFHAAGMGKVITAGVGRSTMDTVPGRTPTYVNIVSGKRSAPMMGSRGM